MVGLTVRQAQELLWTGQLAGYCTARLALSPPVVPPDGDDDLERRIADLETLEERSAAAGCHRRRNLGLPCACLEPGAPGCRYHPGGASRQEH